MTDSLYEHPIYYAASQAPTDVAGWVRLVDELTKSASPVLDIGGGCGELTHAIARTGRRVFMVEPSGAMRREARRKLVGYRCADVVPGTLESLPVGRYSTALARGVLGHVWPEQRLESALRRLREVSAALVLSQWQSDPVWLELARKRLWLEAPAVTIDGREHRVYEAYAWNRREKLLTILTDVPTLDGFPVKAIIRPWTQRELKQILTAAGWKRLEFYSGTNRRKFTRDSETLLIVAHAQ